MTILWIVLILAAWIAMIFYFGQGKWGRSQTQQLIDRLRAHPRIHAFLDRHHGKFRAAFHYLEFGGLTLLVYTGLTWWADGSLREWSDARGAVSGGIGALAALLDELHQKMSSTRQFRRVDYLHSLCGIAIALLLLRYLGL